MKVLYLNVQSPPVARSRPLADALIEEKNDLMVLSELSGGDGSLGLVEALSAAGYAVHWIRPQGRDYAAALVISNKLPHRLLKWEAEYGRARAQFALIRLEGGEHCIGGVYAPSLNAANIDKRVDFFASLESLLQQAVASGRPVLFGGDINEIPPWHEPRIGYYHAEGYPFHRRLPTIGLSDLAQRFLPARSYSWFDRHGAGQLLDAAYVSEAHAHLVQRYELDRHFLESKLSDHCGLRVHYGSAEQLA